jgi:hypothetical protein
MLSETTPVAGQTAERAAFIVVGYLAEGLVETGRITRCSCEELNRIAVQRTASVGRGDMQRVAQLARHAQGNDGWTRIASHTCTVTKGCDNYAGAVDA